MLSFLSHVQCPDKIQRQLASFFNDASARTFSQGEGAMLQIAQRNGFQDFFATLKRSGSISIASQSARETM
jgi:hypothetical protein